MLVNLGCLYYEYSSYVLNLGLEVVLGFGLIFEEKCAEKYLIDVVLLLEVGWGDGPDQVLDVLVGDVLKLRLK